LLNNSTLQFLVAESFEDAAEKSVKAAQEVK